MIAILERIKTGFSQASKLPVPAIEVVYTPPTRPFIKPVQVTSPYASIGVQALVDEVGPLSTGCVLVGACDDKVHFYMDLLDPRPGSVLLVGERGAGQARLLHAIVSSAVLMNSHRNLRFAWLAKDMSQAEALLRQPHCYRIISLSAQDIGAAISQLADLAERRMQPTGAESVLILAIHGLDEFCQRLDDQAFDDLAWLIRNGPLMRLWPFATMDASQAQYVGMDLLNLFGTRILGHMPGQQAAQFGADGAVTSRLVRGKQFCVQFNQQWLNFWAPEPAAITNC